MAAALVGLGIVTLGLLNLSAQTLPSGGEDSDSEVVALAGGFLEVPLPGAVDQVEEAGGDRYLVMKIRAARKVFIYDLQAKQMLGSIPVVDDDALIEAGASSILIAYPNIKLMEQYSLPDLEKTWSDEAHVAAIAMGANADFFLMIESVPSRLAGEWDRSYRFVDAKTMEPHALKSGFYLRRFGSYSSSVIKVSPDGTHYTCTKLDSRPSGVESLVYNISEGMVQTYSQHRTEGVVIPGVGRCVYTQKGWYDATLARFNEVTQGYHHTLIPTSLEDCFMAFNMGFKYERNYSIDEPIHPRMQFRKKGNPEPLLTLELPHYDFILEEKDLKEGWTQTLRTDQRFYYRPEQSLLAYFPPVADVLLLKSVDLEPEQSSDFFYVSSVPVTSVKVGEPLEYQVRVKTNRGPVRYLLESSPEGMTLSKDGLLEFPAQGLTGSYKVSILIVDTSEERHRHSFSFQIVE